MKRFPFKAFKSLARVLACLAAATVFSAPAQAWQDGWSYRTRITLNAGQTDARGELGTTPVLLRLYSGNFTFADARPDGADLRFFAGDDRTPLKFQIEKWNPAEEVGLIWVAMPALSASGPVAIYVYYGNPKAAAGSDAAGTFSGRALVWHFADEGAPQDASGNGLTGSDGGTRNDSGLIGRSLRLDGRTAIALPATFAPTAPVTISLWVKPAAAAEVTTTATTPATPVNGLLFQIPGAMTIGVANGIAYLEAGGQRVAASVPLATDAWTQLAAVADPDKTTLYVNGTAAGELPGVLAAASGVATVGQGFNGEIDELDIAKTALSPATLRLAAVSQGVGARLATFDKPEQVESGGHGYFGILLNALTPDAWAVIIILAIMAVVSWVVMIQKGLFLGRVGAANENFLDAYEQMSASRSEHDGLADLVAGPDAGESSLAHLYRIGQRELKKRLAEGGSHDGRSGSRFAIRGQSIAAIRSALDAGQIREGQRLNKRMVLLTIAIAGGPFLGLLGTVVGVMITFAAVAAAGDVNINAIAPGIAAALLATVAGLTVAIPALFGYNYLLSRVEEMTADNEIFVDELEKRIAETWEDDDRPLPRRAAA